MPAAPPPPNPNPNNLTRDAARFGVLVGPEDGTRPTADQVYFRSWEPVSILRAAGAERVDTITLRKDLKLLLERIEDVTVVAEHGRFFEVRRFDERTGRSAEVLGCGKLAIDKKQIDRESETMEVVARFDGYMLGTPLLYYPTWSTSGLELSAARVDDDLIFNPEIDGRIEGNLSSVRGLNGEGYFLDPESMRTAASRDWSLQTRNTWTLADAVFSLCWLLNANETYVQNPTLSECLAAFGNFSADHLRNARIKLGTRNLGEALDQLLKPLGYWWWLDHRLDPADPDAASTSHLVFFERGYGVLTHVWLQRIGDDMNNVETELSDLGIERDNVSMANKIHVLSDFKRWEGTFALLPGWREAQESAPGTPVDLQNFKRKGLHPDILNVGRKWVFNEAGDYIGNSFSYAEDSENYYQTPGDLTNLLGQFYNVHRRKFERALTTAIPSEEEEDDEQQESMGYFLEWSPVGNPTAADWQRAKWPFSVLEKEMGIYFTGDTPPAELWQILHDEGRLPDLRITASILDDRRLEQVAQRRIASPNADEIPLVIVADKKFSRRSRPADAEDLTSKFLADNQVPPADEIDPTSDMLAYALRVRNVFDSAMLGTVLKLAGADFSGYEIGQLVQAVLPRDIDLNSTIPIPGGEDARYPQIIGINYSLDKEQRMELLTETFRNETLV